MGNSWFMPYKEGTLPDSIPLSSSKPTFDPQLGFKPRRKERDPKMSLEEMKALKLRQDQRDYCAYFLKDLIICRRDYKPFHLLCKSEYHNYNECRYDDYILRMKEFERERRLRLRQKKIEEMGVAA